VETLEPFYRALLYLSTDKPFRCVPHLSFLFCSVARCVFLSSVGRKLSRVNFLFLVGKPISFGSHENEIDPAKNITSRINSSTICLGAVLLLLLWGRRKRKNFFASYLKTRKISSCHAIKLAIIIKRLPSHTHISSHHPSPHPIALSSATDCVQAISIEFTSW
jgi:hypothetical protein